MKFMPAIWLENQELRYRKAIPVPEPPPGEALVRVRLAGICGTDLELVRGYYPYTGVLGHEFVGEVAAAPGTRDWVGRRVVGEINAACHECLACRVGRPTHCERRTVLGIVNRDGAFATYLTLPVENLHLVPDRVPNEAAVFTEPLAAALEIQEQLQIRPTDQVLLIGAGRLGLMIASTLALTGCNLSVVARYPKQRALLEGLGVRAIAEPEVAAGLADIVVEATGAAGGFELARRAVRPRGVIVLKSTYKGQVPVDLAGIIVDEITLLGSRCGPFEPALGLLARGVVDPTPLIEGRYPLDAGLQAMDAASRPGTLKILLEPAD